MAGRILSAALFSLVAATSPALAEGDPARGETLFRPCRACHMIGDGAISRVGPHLNGLMGRHIGAVEGYEYSDDLTEAGVEGEIWDAATLDQFLAGPRQYFPGTNMVFRGVRRDNDRADLIAYLLEQGGEASEDMAAATAGGAGPDPEVAAILAIDGDTAYGAYLSSECTSCHRASGGEGIPSIAGLAPSVFIGGLIGYRDGTREHQVMNMVTQRLGDEEIAALAAFFQTATD